MIVEKKPFYVQCMFCNRVRVAPEKWEHKEIPKGSLVSHGICEACYLEKYGPDEDESQEKEMGSVDKFGLK